MGMDLARRTAYESAERFERMCRVHGAVLADAVASIDALLAEDPARPVLVHCHGGRSRTAFVLKAWAMRRHGWSEGDAHAWLARSWARIHTDNPVFMRVLREEWR